MIGSFQLRLNLLESEAELIFYDSATALQNSLLRNTGSKNWMKRILEILPSNFGKQPKVKPEVVQKFVVKVEFSRLIQNNSISPLDDQSDLVIQHSTRR